MSKHIEEITWKGRTITIWSFSPKIISRDELNSEIDEILKNMDKDNKKLDRTITTMNIEKNIKEFFSRLKNIIWF